jgi:hypothetical protein
MMSTLTVGLVAPHAPEMGVERRTVLPQLLEQARTRFTAVRDCEEQAIFCFERIRLA